MHDDIQEMALKACLPVLTRKLHAAILQPLLKRQQLFTDDNDRQYLLSDSRSHRDKAKFLVNNLPRKRKGWFQSFLWCLKQTTSGTGHDVIHEELVLKCEELRKCASDTKLDGNNVTKEVIICIIDCHAW